MRNYCKFEGSFICHFKQALEKYCRFYLGLQQALELEFQFDLRLHQQQQMFEAAPRFMQKPSLLQLSHFLVSVSAFCNRKGTRIYQGSELLLISLEFLQIT